jgi:PTS system cellobiose-specific IIC component
MLPFNMSMGLMTIFISVGVGASLGKQYSLDPITTGLLSLMSFMLVAADLKNGALSMQYFSGQGIFTALLCSIYATEVYRWLKNAISPLSCRSRYHLAFPGRLKSLFPLLSL